ncbi:hypothetical protein PR003_g6770 [Phytophthora rubi]|uniref:60S ribosomal protein L41 n=1 Tax=Phytophthora rubi TaxID=129364 RepID=A0A6A4FFT9_9STRA|nr:hypothetical protein PR003_g6770 [Phytophthora rubi]
MASSKFLLSLVTLLAFPVLVAASLPSINYGTLTWSKWEEVYTTAQTDTVTMSRMYRTGPRVRAKIMVGNDISMNDFQAGEAIFRQRIQDIVGVERSERVQLEYLQTEACTEEEPQTYYVALGISALPPPLNSSGNDLMLSSISAERERIVQNLRYGNIVNSANVTINSITLFGTSMDLVDVTLEGESFAQLYLKPWVGIQLAIASTVSAVMGINTSASEHYTMDRDAFQDLRLRFLLTQRLQSLQVRASDIIVHSPNELLPFTTYTADTGVLNIEIHVHDIRYADSVETYLLGEDTSASNNAVASAFNEMEPDWRLIAMDVDTEAGRLFSLPARASTWIDTGNSGDSVALIELTFALYNISLAQLERAKWSVLGFVRSTASQVAPSSVRFGRITFPSSSIALTTHNDGDDGALASDSIFDRVNAINWTLSFKVEPKTSGAYDSVALSDHIVGSQSNVESGLQVALGFTETTDNRSVSFQSATDWVDSELEATPVVDPYVSFTLTIIVEPLDASALPVVRRRQFGDLAVMDATDQPVPAFITAEIPELIDDGNEATNITITLNLQQPRLGGLYSGSLLDGVAPSCSECTTLLEDCNNTPECRAFSACVGVLLEADLTLIASMLEKDEIDSSVDATWLFRDCLSPSDGTEWSSTVREMLESSYACLWENSCPVAYSTEVGRKIVLDHSPGEQSLTFNLANGFASISFELDTWAYTFVEDFTANATEVTGQLDTMLTEMYRTAFSNVATVKSSLVTTEDPDSGVVTAQLTILYKFLGRLVQPFVTLNGGTLGYNSTEESLHLRVVLITAIKPHFLLTALLGTSFRHLSIQEGRMQLFVETLSGSPLTLSVAADASVASVKQAVEDVEYIPNFRLVCAGKQLTSGSLADYAVGECDTLKMLLDVNGGMRAKWRKKRMRRLRRKRRKMRQRAR